QAVVMLGPLLEPPHELERETGRVCLPLPKQSELEVLFRRVLADEPEAAFADEDFEACTRAALGLTAGEAVRVLRRSRASTQGLGPDTAHAIAGAKSEALRRTPALQFYEPGEGLEGIGGLDDLKAWLRERRRAFSTEARLFGLPQPRGLLLLGVQGCGKSLAAKSVSVEWQFPLLRLDLAAVFSNAQHSPEETIRQATAIAESIAPAVLWIDEIEKGFSASQSDPSASRVLGAFLTWMAEKTASVFVVATANDVSNLPPELLRRGRFDELFFVDLPNPEERISILSIHLQRYGRDPHQFMLESLAEESERLSGAELEQAVQAGLYTAFSEGRELEPKDLLNAIHETVPLYETYEDRIKELRDWARQRARPAASDLKMVDLFRSGS
ncbi:AAA family ATPase, partial [Myxococcota bacterium]|nr:AAA family ATPase [Myxococcota bacterium]